MQFDRAALPGFNGGKGKNGIVERQKPQFRFGAGLPARGALQRQCRSGLFHQNRRRQPAATRK
jgi:hypothetical protein